MKRKARKEVAPADLSIAEKTHDQQNSVINADPEAIAKYVMEADINSRVPISINRR